jgi:hypothetical protein
MLKTSSGKIATLIVMVALVAGCSGMEITGDTNNQAMAYLAGKGMAMGVYKVQPTAAPVIEQAWMDMMGRSYGLPEITAAELQGFFNEVLLKQIPTLKDDPYGLSGDLAFFATLYGAQFTGGQMTALKPIPMIVAKAFQAGYEGGRSVAIAMK